MAGQVCVVTGSSSGIGAATAKLYATNGWNIAINYSKSGKAAEAVARECRDLGAEVEVVQANVAEDGQCRHFADVIAKRWGRCDVLVNNAGTTKFVDLKDLDGLSSDDFQAIYSVNVIGAFQTIRAFVPLLRNAPGSSVVNVSSIAPQVGGGSSIAYIASKGALNALTLTMARVLGPSIRVNAVAPGMVDSQWLRDGLGEARFESFRQAYVGASALGTIIEPGEVAEAIYWLGAKATQTTGEVLLIDGGRRIGRA